MKKYYKLDSRWEVYQFDNQEDYAKELVISGYFHDQVPEDVLKAYETAEYLMAHAYYHWPMYDEALHKVLLILEMGIKLKAKKSGIPIYELKKRRKRPVKLYNLINKICNKEYLNDLKQKLHRSRNLRNMQVHPKKNSFSGAMGGIPRNIKYCINVLNRLFRNEEWHKNHQRKIIKFSANPIYLEGQMLIAESATDKRVISSILDFDIIDNTLLLVCLPVLDVEKLKSDNKEGLLPDPVTYTLNNYELETDGITGKTLNGGKIKIYPTEHNNVIEAFKKYRNYMQSRSEQDKRIYLDLLLLEVPWNLSIAEYQHLSRRKQ